MLHMQTLSRKVIARGDGGHVFGKVYHFHNSSGENIIHAALLIFWVLLCCSNYRAERDACWSSGTGAVFLIKGKQVSMLMKYLPCYIGRHTHMHVRVCICVHIYVCISILQNCCCSVAKSCLILCDPMNYSTPDFPVLHYLPEFAQTYVH